MEISSKKGAKWLEETKKELNKNIERQVKELKISKLDKNLFNEVKKLLGNKKGIQKIIEMNIDDNKKVDSSYIKYFDWVDEQIKYYVNLGQMRKQQRTNKILMFLTGIMIIFMTIQILISKGII